MLSNKAIWLVAFLYGTTFVKSTFNPFMDSELFAINWASADLKDVSPGDDSIVVMTKQKERYQCVFPDLQKANEDSEKNDEVPSADELMETLFTQPACSYRIESYWTYELCHGRHLRQFHEDKEPTRPGKLQEYFLGYGKHLQAEEDEKVAEEVALDRKLKTRKIDGLELPYYEVWMTDGTKCDLTNKPRRSRVMYICQADGHGEIYELKETSTCEYDVTVLTAALCIHPDYRPKTAPVNEIQCLPLANSPPRPRQLEMIEKEEKQGQSFVARYAAGREEEKVREEGAGEAATPTQQKTKIYRKQPDIIGPHTDKNIVRGVISGDHCLKGGGGWWKYEFCYGKHARQYHDDPEGRTVVNLGYWDEAKHKAWIDKNPSKRLGKIGERKFISLFLGDGDVCDMTGLKRFVEVRLKCVANTQHPHSVALYLMEPHICEYVLGIESPIFCPLIDQADEYGLLKNVNLE